MTEQTLFFLSKLRASKNMHSSSSYSFSYSSWSSPSVWDDENVTDDDDEEEQQQGVDDVEKKRKRAFAPAKPLAPSKGANIALGAAEEFNAAKRLAAEKLEKETGVTVELALSSRKRSNDSDELRLVRNAAGRTKKVPYRICRVHDCLNQAQFAFNITTGANGAHAVTAEQSSSEGVPVLCRGCYTNHCGINNNNNDSKHDKLLKRKAIALPQSEEVKTNPDAEIVVVDSLEAFNADKQSLFAPVSDQFETRFNPNTGLLEYRSTYSVERFLISKNSKNNGGSDGNDAAEAAKASAALARKVRFQQICWIKGCGKTSQGTGKGLAENNDDDDDKKSKNDVAVNDNDDDHSSRSRRSVITLPYGQQYATRFCSQHSGRPKCREPGCQTPAQSIGKGYCTKHATAHGIATRKKCDHPVCSTPRNGGSKFCGAHAPDEEKKKKYCTYVSAGSTRIKCMTQARSNGLCWVHGGAPICIACKSAVVYQKQYQEQLCITCHSFKHDWAPRRQLICEKDFVKLCMESPILAKQLPETPKDLDRTGVDRKAWQVRVKTPDGTNPVVDLLFESECKTFFVLVEHDEHQHMTRSYTPICEETRLGGIFLSEKVSGKPVFVIRLNCDEYTDKHGIRRQGCYNRDIKVSNITDEVTGKIIKKTYDANPVMKKALWKKRMFPVMQRIEELVARTACPTTMYQVEYWYYDEQEQQRADELGTTKKKKYKQTNL